MTDQEIKTRIQALAKERDQARQQADDLKREMLNQQNELHHLRHFKSSVERGLRNLPGGGV